MNVITGLPRSGSTLLCNILNQNPSFWATSTSILPQLCSVLVNNWSNSLEFKGELATDRDEAESRILRATRAFCDAWHERTDGRSIVFDKSRGWSHNILMLRKIYPESKVIVLVRDLRDVFASIEKQHRKNALLDEANDPSEKTLYKRADIMFSPQGIIGRPIEGLSDIIQRKLKTWVVRYEDLVRDPDKVTKGIYNYLEIDSYEHDFENIKNTATDPDAFYLYKFPHEGEGKIKKSEETWRDYIPEDIEKLIRERFEFFNRVFKIT